MPRVVLETIGISKFYGGVRASDHVNFKLEKGELRCLIGPNGAGKSTFFKCICGLTTPSEGHVYMNGVETTGWLPHQISSLGVGIKTQIPNVFDGLNTEENIWIAANRFFAEKDSTARTHHMIEQFALSAIARTEVGRLSHGERQRVELAMVMISEPWLMLLDEPAAGMSAEDLEHIKQILDRVLSVSSIVIVEHDMQFIRSIAHKVTVFHQGGVLIEDHVDTVLNNPVVRDVYLGKQA